VEQKLKIDLSKLSKSRIFFSIISQKRYLITVVISIITYFIIYLAATKFLILSFRIEPMESFFGFKLLPNWTELMFRQRSTILFESIGVIYIGPIKLFLSIGNFLIAIVLGILVGTNISVSYYSFRSLSLRGTKGFISLLGTIPAIVSGAACCVPTLILVIGLQLTATLVAIWTFFVPLSALLLLLSLWWSLRRIQRRNCKF
jgi:hypothetical protein